MPRGAVLHPDAETDLLGVEYHSTRQALDRLFAGLDVSTPNVEVEEDDATHNYRGATYNVVRVDAHFVLYSPLSDEERRNRGRPADREPYLAEVFVRRILPYAPRP